MWMLYYFFFFSSRRRHTRCSRDWSSDVCSSDLVDALHQLEEILPRLGTPREDHISCSRIAAHVHLGTLEPIIRGKANRLAAAVAEQFGGTDRSTSLRYIS